jgi:Fe-S oxidoreductase
MLGAMAVPVAWNSVIGLILFGLGCFTLLPLAWMLAAGPMRHALAGALHLAWHPRPERFGSTAATGLRLVDLDATQVGVGRSTDFTWNQILGFDACVQCGRCEAVCPANAAGLPLNPKKLINDLIGNIAPIHYAGNPHPGIPASSEASGSELVVGQKAPVSQETLWACTTCRACVEACPMLIEHVDAVIDMRRFQTLELAATPGKAPEVLAASAETDTCSGRPVSERLNFASDLGLPRLTQGVPVDILLWLGDSAFNTRNQRSLRALLKVLKQAQLSFAVLDDEADCGDTCRRLGDEFEFNRLAAGNIERLRAFQFARIVTLDPHVAHCLKVEYPALGGNYSVLHHTALLAELLEQRVLAVQQSPNLKVTYHDPCYLSRYLGQTEAARNIIAKSGMDFVEMQRHGRQSFCCGAGGGASITDVAGKRRIPDLRMEQACDTGAEIVLVACPNCTNMLEGATVKGPRVMEISEYLLEHLLPDTGPAATYVRINPADSSLNKVSA